MKLVNLRIKNFKCILDSTDFAVDQLTCLVGKNESGKSAILQALYKLNPIDEKAKYNPLYDYPKMYLTDYESGDVFADSTVVVSTWVMDSSEKKEFESKWGDNALANDSIMISSRYTNKRQWAVSLNYDALFSAKMTDCKFTQSDYAHFQDKSTIATMRNELKAISTASEPEQSFIAWFNEYFPNDDDVSVFAEKELLAFVPKFMYFSEYQKMPGRIAIDNYISKKQSGTLTENEKVFEALLTLANTSIEDIKGSSKLEELINKTRGVSSKITREIFEYWSQNKHLKVDFRCDMAKAGDGAPFNSGYIFSTRIENTRHDSTVSFDDRSAGFVWFFSFLIWFNKLQRENKRLFVLLDEPGLNLHAKAQSDLLRYFKERIITKFQLIYTTHSPFMLDFSDILSSRTVEDTTGDNGEVLGTKVGSRVLSKDKDTIFPLQAAFGYDITQTLFIGKNTLLVEGPSDILYLNYFSNTLREKGRTYLSEKWTICPSGGIDKIQSFVSLFSGNALKVASLTDYHEGDKTKIEKLRSSGILSTGHILVASDYTGLRTSDIEDIIGSNAYITLVNKCYGLENKEKIPLAENVSGKILSYVEEKIKNFDSITFSHYTPSVFLIEHPSVWKDADISEALDRFEKLFVDLNGLL
jgi:predicted ATPase